jgi:hypothetical protein
MHRSMDMKSVIMGGLLVALILCLTGAVPLVNHGDYDRFKIETNDSHAFVLDSATGQVWSSIFIGNQFQPHPDFHAVKIYDPQTPSE